jgi:hypothetical protein
MICRLGAFAFLRADLLHAAVLRKMQTPMPAATAWPAASIGECGMGVGTPSRCAETAGRSDQESRRIIWRRSKKKLPKAANFLPDRPQCRKIRQLVPVSFRFVLSAKGTLMALIKKGCQALIDLIVRENCLFLQNHGWRIRQSASLH